MSSDTGNRTPSCRVRDGDVNHYTISDVVGLSQLILIYKEILLRGNIS